MKWAFWGLGGEELACFLVALGLAGGAGWGGYGN